MLLIVTLLWFLGLTIDRWLAWALLSLDFVFWSVRALYALLRRRFGTELARRARIWAGAGIAIIWTWTRVTLRWLNGAFRLSFLVLNQALTEVYLCTQLCFYKFRYFFKFWRGKFDLIFQRLDIGMLVPQKTKQKLELFLKLVSLGSQRVPVNLRLTIQSLFHDFVRTFQTFQSLHDLLKLVSSELLCGFFALLWAWLLLYLLLFFIFLSLLSQRDHWKQFTLIDRGHISSSPVCK